MGDKSFFFKCKFFPESVPNSEIFVQKYARFTNQSNTLKSDNYGGQPSTLVCKIRNIVRQNGVKFAQNYDLFRYKYFVTNIYCNY